MAQVDADIERVISSTARVLCIGHTNTHLFAIWTKGDMQTEKGEKTDAIFYKAQPRL